MKLAIWMRGTTICWPFATGWFCSVDTRRPPKQDPPKGPGGLDRSGRVVSSHERVVAADWGMRIYEEVLKPLGAKEVW